jgi:hypothetical protein
VVCKQPFSGSFQWSGCAARRFRHLDFVIPSDLVIRLRRDFDVSAARVSVRPSSRRSLAEPSAERSVEPSFGFGNGLITDYCPLPSPKNTLELLNRRCTQINADMNSEDPRRRSRATSCPSFAILAFVAVKSSRGPVVRKAETRRDALTYADLTSDSRPWD